MMEEIVVDNHPFGVYWAAPPSGAGVAILVCHAWWGLNEFILQFCDRLATAGFGACAPDLFDGRKATTIAAAGELPKQIDRKLAQRKIRAAHDYLGSRPEVAGTNIGAIGFSYGASFAIEAARMRPQHVRAVVLYYGTGGGNLDRTEAAFQGHFAEHDRWGAHPKKVRALAQRIEAANQPADFYTYPGTQHWFFEDDRPEYDPAAAELAWERMISFLRATLQP